LLDDTHVDNTEIERLKKAIAKERRGVTKPGLRFNTKLRDEVIAHVRKRQQTGETLKAIALSLGIKRHTLRYWLYGLVDKGSGKASRFRAIGVIEKPSNSDTGVTVLGPGGTRIDGLTLGQAAELLRRLS
jgi:hypothetical protein